jgi:histone-lysine N-methyltransferase SETD2
MHKQENSEQKWKSVEKRQTENGKGYDIFVKENCKEGDLIIEYVGQVVRKIKRNSTVYIMTVFEKQLWIDATNMGGLAKFMSHSCNPNCKLEQWEVNGFPRMCFFCNQRNQGGRQIDL